MSNAAIKKGSTSYELCYIPDKGNVLICNKNCHWGGWICPLKRKSEITFPQLYYTDSSTILHPLPAKKNIERI